MKKMVLALLIAIGVSGVAGLRSASAQDAPALVTVGFPFVVADKVLPAGSYQITADFEHPTVLLIQNMNPRVRAAAAFVSTERTPNPNPDDPQVEVSFKNVDGHMFLWRVATPGGDANDITLTKAAAERTLAALNLLRAEPGSTDSGSGK